MTNVTAFIQPSPQKALDGELGLSSLDIAQVLGARHEHVKEHVNRLKSIDPTFTVSAVKLHEARLFNCKSRCQALLIKSFGFKIRSTVKPL